MEKIITFLKSIHFKVIAAALLFLFISILLNFFNSQSNSTQPKTTKGSSGATVNQELPRKSTVNITTNTIPLLEPHPHATIDSLFDPSHHVIIESKTFTTKRDAWVTGIEVKINNAPLSILHHAVLLALNETDPICPEANRRMLLFGSDAVAPIKFPEGYAVFMPKGTVLLFNAMVHNPEPPLGPGGEYRDVSVNLAISLEEARANVEKKSIEYYQLAVEDEPCSIKLGNVFKVPPFSKHFVKTYQTSTPVIGAYTFLKDGALIGMGAHLHAWSYGEKLLVYINDKLFTTFESIQAATSTWSWNTMYEAYPIPVKVKQGDTIAISAVYSNPTPETITDAMGMLGFYFAPD